jgi:hypothetical protein
MRVGWVIILCIAAFALPAANNLAATAQGRSVEGAPAPEVIRFVNYTRWVDVDGAWEGVFDDATTQRRWVFELNLISDKARISGTGTVSAATSIMPIRQMSKKQLSELNRVWQGNATVEGSMSDGKSISLRIVGTLDGKPYSFEATTTYPRDGRSLSLRDPARSTAVLLKRPWKPAPAYEPTLHPWAASTGMTIQEYETQQRAAQQVEAVSACRDKFQRAKTQKDFAAVMGSCSPTDPDAMFYSAQINEKGLDGEENLIMARNTYRVMANGGDARGADGMARIDRALPEAIRALLARGSAALQSGNNEDAINSYIRASNYGSAEASLKLALLAEQGKVYQDPDPKFQQRRIEGWYRTAAEQGDKTARSRVAADMKKQADAIQASHREIAEECRSRTYVETYRNGILQWPSAKEQMDICLMQNAESLESLRQVMKRSAEAVGIAPPF